MKRLVNTFISRNYILSAIFIVAVLAIIENKIVAADEPPAFFLKIAKNIPRIGRSEPYDEYAIKNSNVKDDIPWHKGEISKRRVGFSPESNTYAWQHFPLAIEGPPELWRTLAGYSHDPLYKTTDDFNNELWSRDKRTNNPEA
ncbi:ecdysis triggering hormone preproprotein [Nasonia vitripennis]|uniref:Ecdysis triggering hormone n=1 Tax=Nasonia vitripennis TaxID=7425 RepID=A0A7M6UVK2_NASVI|nr:ecdysis triggering hormone preproprotein [Nasonia vitripennis]